MEINIKCVSSIEELQSRNDVRFMFFAKNIFPRSSVYLLGGLLLIILSLYDNYLIEFTRTLGILSIFQFLSFLYQSMVVKRQLRQSLDRYIHRATSFSFEVQISEEALWYKDFELEQRCKWSAFSSYVANDTFIALFSDNNPLSSVIVFKKDVTDSEYNIIKTFLKSKLPYGNC
jgi:hypothetical protein